MPTTVHSAHIQTLARILAESNEKDCAACLTVMLVVLGYVRLNFVRVRFVSHQSGSSAAPVLASAPCTRCGPGIPCCDVP